MVRVGPPGILLADLPFRYEAFAKQELDYVALGFKTLWQLLEYWKDFVKLTKEVNVKYVLRYSVRLRRYYSAQLPQMPVIGRQESFVIDSDDEVYFTCDESSGFLIWRNVIWTYLNWKYMDKYPKLQLRQI